jgi:hypothetical protein
VILNFQLEKIFNFGSGSKSRSEVYFGSDLFIIETDSDGFNVKSWIRIKIQNRLDPQQCLGTGIIFLYLVMGPLCTHPK